MTTKEFNALPKRDRKILVAKDIIKQVTAGRYVAGHRGYVRNLNLKDTTDIQKNFSRIKDCTVCAVGSAILSTTKFLNQLTAGDVSNYNAMSNIPKVRKIVESVFTKKELSLMETAYERDSIGNYGSRLENETSGAEAIEFGKLHQEPDDRLIAICKNIIKHGTFKP